MSVFDPGSTKPNGTLTGLDGPYAMAFDSSGDLFVANQSNSTVSEFAAGSSSTKPAATFTGFNGPYAMAFDSSGDLFVANYGFGAGSTVSEFNPGGTKPSVTLNGLTGPDAWSLTLRATCSWPTGPTGPTGLAPP